MGVILRRPVLSENISNGTRAGIGSDMLKKSGRLAFRSSPAGSGRCVHETGRLLLRGFFGQQTQHPSDCKYPHVDTSVSRTHPSRPRKLRLATRLAVHRDADGRADRDFDLSIAAALSGVTKRLVVGPGVLQPVVLGIDAGRRHVTVRPVSAYAQEGPSIWKMNYLAPIRLAFAPFCWTAPDPRILIVIQNVMFWWVVPAAYMLVRSESRSESVALSAAALVPLTPLFWPLVLNDFRELQLVGAFVLWAVQGVRSRSPGLSAVGIAGMLACRQEFAVMVATFAFLPPREPESLSVTLRWRQVMLLVGLFWLFFGFFGYLSFMVGRGAPDAFIDQFFGPKASLSRDLADFARDAALGDGGLGDPGLSGASGCSAGVALDLGPVQWPLGHALPVVRRLAPRSLCRAGGRHGPGRGPDRLRAAGPLVIAETRRPSRAGLGLDGRGRVLRRGPSRRVGAAGGCARLDRSGGVRTDLVLDSSGWSGTMR